MMTIPSHQNRRFEEQLYEQSARIGKAVSSPRPRRKRSSKERKLTAVSSPQAGDTQAHQTYPQ
jgi:hypothetical protein